MATSRDEGKTFTKLGSGPVLSFSPDEPFVLSGPKIRRFNETYYLWYIAGRKWKIIDGRAEPVYKIRMASSPDGIHWIKMNKDLIPSRIEEDEAQASPDVFYSNGKYHMFLLPIQQPLPWQRKWLSCGMPQQNLRIGTRCTKAGTMSRQRVGLGDDQLSACF
jgi:hypothetical protein